MLLNKKKTTNVLLSTVSIYFITLSHFIILKREKNSDVNSPAWTAQQFPIYLIVFFGNVNVRVTSYVNFL